MKNWFLSLSLALLAIATFPACQWFTKSQPCSSCPAHRKHTNTVPTNLVQHINSKAQFEHLIATATKPVVVEFGAHWCGACQEMKPILTKVATATQDRYIIATVELTKAKELQTELDIKGIPVIYLFKDGKELHVDQRPVGAMPEKELLAFLAKHLDTASH